MLWEKGSSFFHSHLLTFWGVMKNNSFYNTEMIEELEKVKSIIIENINSTYSEISEPLKEIIKADSKMLRPALVLLAARFGEYDREKLYPLAAAVEMLHTATIIHDDIIDSAGTRRGLISLNFRFGSRQSVLMGDYLLSKAYRLIISRLDSRNQDLIAAVISRLCEGEIAESSGAYSIEVSEKKYLRLIAGKTASLFALSLHLGASESDTPEPEVSVLRRAGYNIGMGFQIIDDILDFTGSEKKLGKPAGNDLKEGVFTLPLIYALEQKNSALLEELGRSNPYSRETVEEIIRLTSLLGGIEKAREKAALYTGRAVREIEKLKDSIYRQSLLEIVEKLLLREY